MEHFTSSSQNISLKTLKAHKRTLQSKANKKKIAPPQNTRCIRPPPDPNPCPAPSITDLEKTQWWSDSETEPNTPPPPGAGRWDKKGGSGSGTLQDTPPPLAPPRGPGVGEIREGNKEKDHQPDKKKGWGISKAGQLASSIISTWKVISTR